MRLVDTSAWIEWLVGSRTGEAVAAELPAQEAWLVPTIVQLELSKWLLREVDEVKADQVTAFTERCVVVTLDTKLALAAAEIGMRHKLATADSIIYASALARNADVLTCDAHFDSLASVRYIAKL